MTDAERQAIIDKMLPPSLPWHEVKAPRSVPDTFDPPPKCLPCR